MLLHMPGKRNRPGRIIALTMKWAAHKKPEEAREPESFLEYVSDVRYVIMILGKRRKAGYVTSDFPACLCPRLG